MIVENYGNNKLMTFADLCIGDTFEIFGNFIVSNKLCIKTNNEDFTKFGNAMYYDSSDKTWCVLIVRLDAEVKKIKSKLVVEN